MFQIMYADTSFQGEASSLFEYGLNFMTCFQRIENGKDKLVTLSGEIWQTLLWPSDQS